MFCGVEVCCLESLAFVLYLVEFCLLLGLLFCEVGFVLNFNVCLGC